ncbi:hypothetical protein HYE60_05980, partial [Aggregatibacter actinomycetemcomitans]|uniref:hypothetical protein n=1 Tax=Aggregatibacter actinomycetemcomitans TaxID=714 RepID=UPI00197C34C3
YISHDPIGLLGGFNPYGYVKNPNRWIDFLGLEGQISFGEAFNQAKSNLGIPANVPNPEPQFVWGGNTENRYVWAFDGEHSGKYVVMHLEDKFGRGPHLHTATDVQGKPSPTIKSLDRYNQHEGHIPEDIIGIDKETLPKDQLHPKDQKLISCKGK